MAGSYGNQCSKLDLTEIAELTFFAPDMDRFPALALARNALRAGGAQPAILNASNEIAVEAFLNGELPFTGITELIGDVLQAVSVGEPKTIDDVIALDLDIRAQARALISNASRTSSLGIISDSTIEIDA